MKKHNAQKIVDGETRTNDTEKCVSKCSVTDALTSVELGHLRCSKVISTNAVIAGSPFVPPYNEKVNFTSNLRRNYTLYEVALVLPYKQQAIIL